MVHKVRSPSVPSGHNDQQPQQQREELPKGVTPVVHKVRSPSVPSGHSHVIERSRTKVVTCNFTAAKMATVAIDEMHDATSASRPTVAQAGAR